MEKKDLASFLGEKEDLAKIDASFAFLLFYCFFFFPLYV